MENSKKNNEDKNLTEVLNINKKTVSHAGIHLFVDLWGASNLNSPEETEKVLIQAAKDAKATVLYSYMHRFQPHGVSGVVVLAESHISIHTWPEKEYAAIDIFMCGNADPYSAINKIKEYFTPERIIISENKRGITIDS